MLKIFTSTTFFSFLMCFISCKEKEAKVEVKKSITNYCMEEYRPQFHFTPEEKWMNDPNGLVYHDGVYHLFYQYYPGDIVWGPMHWGHAISKDMVRWEHKPIALFPDENGFIFSGSAVVDINNTSGFGSDEAPALVAIFTYHNMEGEQAGRSDFQTQGIAYSLDNGDSWIKYEGNPVIGNDGIKDFRDPKVFWNEKENIWTMLLVAGDHLQIWDSPNLKEWEQVSEFGKDNGAHGGVWECPDMFKLKVAGTDEEKWVLLISINPGAPNGGSGTQYFIGDFDGKTFTTEQTESKWVDYGRDNYAGVTYNNVPSGDRIFIGWMSNWDYARDTPTKKWRSAMTIPRKLSLEKNDGSYELINYPLHQVDGLVKNKVAGKDFVLHPHSEKKLLIEHGNQSELIFKTADPNFSLTMANIQGDSLFVRLNKADKSALMNRSKAGKTGFSEKFALGNQQMPMPNLPDGEIEIRILLDKSSIELFVNKGQYVMTNQVFPKSDFTELVFKNNTERAIGVMDFTENLVERIWE
ncbi:glycoside hydrolase family 32 protein [Maribacter sp. CXY002]|uniref:glycoside hydrolase family 32 protein n=1 Tax=Maribacter luteocoastalis TaxID=3407671 RepID=UPI003B674A7D